MCEYTKSQTYLIASCKEWHQSLFDTLKCNKVQRWLWVKTPEELEAELIGNKPRYIFFLHWNWIVPESIWSIYECVCFHMTDVPYGRGGSPLQNLVLAGHKTTVLTALQMVAELDAGPVYRKKQLPLSGAAQEIYERAGRLSIELIKWMISTNPEPLEQRGKVVTFKRRKPEQSRLPESNHEISIYDFIRMLDADGYPHAFIEHGDFRLEFRNARLNGAVVSAQVKIISKTDRSS